MCGHERDGEGRQEVLGIQITLRSSMAQGVPRVFCDLCNTLDSLMSFGSVF